jgi:hypothetical protein
MNLRRRLPTRQVTLAVALLLGCGGSDGAPKTVSITGVGWYEENIDPSFWPASPPSGHAHYDFMIHYAGDITFADLQYARVYLPDGRYWLISANSNYFDATNRVIGGWGRWRDNIEVDALPIGPLQVEVKLTNGVVATHTLTVPAPGSTTAGSYTTMHTEDLFSPPASSAPMVERAGIGPTNTLTAATGTISLTFSVTDPKVYDGFVWFYDAAGAYLGAFVWFRDPLTGQFASQLAGSTLHTEGTSNTLTLQAADLRLNAGATFGQIASFHVVLTDGAQYTQGNSSLRYDCRSVSARGSLTVQ